MLKAKVNPTKVINATKRRFNLIKQDSKQWRVISEFSFIINQVVLKALVLPTRIMKQKTQG